MQQQKTLVTEFVPDAGLGNCMFEWAAGRAIAKRLGAEHTWVYRPSIKRRYELDTAFGIPHPTKLPKYELVFDMQGKGDATMLDVAEEKIRNHPDEACGIRAPFQAEECFAEIADEIREIFKLDPLPLNVPEGRTPVSVQVRRGDYVGHVRLDVTTPAYFRKGIEWMRDRIERPHFFVTSDDPDWCRKEFHGDRDLTVLPPQDSVTGLRAMIACDAHVISNSTFGWWGAWLAERGPVVVPEIWHFIEGLYGEWEPAPRRWIRLGGCRPDQKPAHKHRIPFRRLPPPSLDRAIVYPWHSDKAKWEELRFSLRSIDKFFEDKECPIFILANERPGWLLNDAPRVQYVNAWSYPDALIQGTQIADKVLWMNDDIFLLKPTTWEDCAVPRYVGTVSHTNAFDTNPDRNSWKAGVAEILQRLARWGYRDHKVYSTHTPYVYDRRKMVDVLERFGDLWHKFAAEVAYFHVHSEGERKLGQEFTQGPELGQAQFLNVTDMLLIPELKDALLRLLPDRSPWEHPDIPLEA